MRTAPYGVRAPILIQLDTSKVKQVLKGEHAYAPCDFYSRFLAHHHVSLPDVARHVTQFAVALDVGEAIVQSVYTPIVGVVSFIHKIHYAAA